nr:unnamed protein product [Callosobruchus analis]
MCRYSSVVEEEEADDEDTTGSAVTATGNFFLLKWTQWNKFLFNTLPRDSYNSS